MKWHTLCLKMMKEGDTSLVNEKFTCHRRRCHHHAAPGPASSTKSIASKASKRTREESDSQEKLKSCRALWNRVLFEAYVHHPFPVASASLHNSSTAVNPSSHPSSTSSPPPLIVKATISPTSATPSMPPATPLNIMTFNLTCSPNDKTCFDVFGAIDIPQTRPVKRRKSYDSPLSGNKTMEDGKIDESSGPSREGKDGFFAELVCHGFYNR